MAIPLKDYEKTVHTGIKMNKKNHQRFLLEYSISGKRFRKLFDCNPSSGMKKRLKEAYEQREALIGAKEIEAGTSADIYATVDDYFEIYQRDKKWKPNVKKGIEGVYKNYIEDIIGDMKIVDVRSRHINAINDNTAQLGRAPSTRKKVIEILVPLFRRAVSDEVIAKSPMTKEHNIQRNQKQEIRLVQNAVHKYKAIYKAIMSVYAKNPHHRALMLFGFSGRRKTETLMLEWEDITFKENEYTVPKINNKAGADMTFTMNQDIKEALMAFRGHSGRIFNISDIRGLVEKIRDESKVEEFGFHYMRNVLVSALSTQGVEAITLSGILGHTDTATVRRYLDLQRKEASQIAIDASKALLG